MASFALVRHGSCARLTPAANAVRRRTLAWVREQRPCPCRRSHFRHTHPDGEDGGHRL